MNQTTVNFYPDFEDMISIVPRGIIINFNETYDRVYNISVIAKRAGESLISIVVDTPAIRLVINRFENKYFTATVCTDVKINLFSFEK